MRLCSAAHPKKPNSGNNHAAANEEKQNVALSRYKHDSKPGVTAQSRDTRCNRGELETPG